MFFDFDIYIAIINALIIIYFNVNCETLNETLNDNNKMIIKISK